MKKLLLTFLIAFITALGLNAKDYYTVLFGKDYNSKSVQTYDDSLSHTMAPDGILQILTTIKTAGAM